MIKKGGMGMRAIFRRANSVDAKPLRQLFRKAHRQNAILGYVFPAYRMSTEKIRRLIRRDDYYLLKNTRRIIATVALKKRIRYIEIGSLAVRPGYRKQGYGSKLLRFAEYKLIKRGRTQAVLFTPKGHPYLMEYYRKRGYRKTNIRTWNGVQWIQLQKKL